MLLIVGCTGYPRDNSKYCAQSIVRTVDRVGDPTAASPVPAFAFQDFVQRGTWTNGRRHGAKRSCMRFFFECALAQKFLHVLFTGKSTLGLIMKFGFLPFFRRFHSANGDFGSGNFVPPAAETARDRIFQYRRVCSEVSEFFLPALRVTLFRFGHAQKNTLAFLVPLAFGQITIRLRGLHFGLPIAFNDFDGLAPTFWITKRIF